jgi:hypothetical protein
MVAIRIIQTPRRGHVAANNIKIRPEILGCGAFKEVQSRSPGSRVRLEALGITFCSVSRQFVARKHPLLLPHKITIRGNLCNSLFVNLELPFDPSQDASGTFNTVIRGFLPTLVWSLMAQLVPVLAS